MIYRMLFAVAVCAGSLAFTSSTSEAGDCYYGRRAYAPAYGYGYNYGYGYRGPAVSVSRFSYSTYRPRVYGAPYYRPNPSLRYGRPIGYGYPVYGSGIGVGRGGVSIGIGF